ncbi:MAG: DNA repair protein RecN [Bacteroidales bacterium]|nr:DNA repair protein RecN [Bacteroidales bacterium]
MLQSLSINNYALIDELNIKFNQGFSIITGETGAGKSILLGAISLILGQRADTSILKNKDNKCIIEGVFDISEYSLHDFFDNNDLDFEKFTIIRREINPNGKSRAFINDTPANISILKELGSKLVDIHSQHQNLILNDTLFQLFVVDIMAQHKDLLNEYKNDFKEYKKLNNELNNLIEKSEKEKQDLDYLQFQYNQLEEANLIADEQEDLENDLETLTHSEEIKTNLSKAFHLLSGEGETSISQINEVKSSLSLLNKFFSKSIDLSQRIDSVLIELNDISNEIEIISNDVEYNPDKITNIKERLDLIYSLQQKHRVSTINELIEIKSNLENQINEISSFDSEIDELTVKLKNKYDNLVKKANKISSQRKKVIPEIEEKIIELLQSLGMPNAKFKILQDKTEQLSLNGLETVTFLFSANKKVEMQSISKVASGGELSRLMLSIKSIISKSIALPTIIFDEIDIGVAGEIADKMGNIMLNMSKNMQVVSITHLPQIASKGQNHYTVYKDDYNDTTTTNIKLLDDDERVVEIAKMLSGESVTNAAFENAKDLLRFNS